MEAFEPDTEQLAMARQVMEKLKLDFAGVDLLFGKDREPILCEVNSNAHFVNLQECTGVNVAEKIIKYCLNEIKFQKN